MMKDVLNFHKESNDAGGLRLVQGNTGIDELPAIEEQFVNFMFFHVNPDWRKLNADTKRIFKSEFQSTNIPTNGEPHPN